MLFDALLPGTETMPGALDAGAVDFLDAQLSQDDGTYFELRSWKLAYSQLLPELDRTAATRFGHGLDQLSRAEATELLGELEQAALNHWPAGLDQRRAFAMLRSHCIEGCFADPRWGGNRDFLMWRWLGYGEPATDYLRPAAEPAEHGDEQ
ncbi:MAG TPA: gluconate 2-dehydrogenase subunit 3 family protein [Jatrophihabitans sp.]|nr:gluconate 2-dehydrogenase subunit 3 family protein [Jatrophihabitans sp.]